MGAANALPSLKRLVSFACDCTSSTFQIKVIGKVMVNPGGSLLVVEFLFKHNPLGEVAPPSYFYRKAALLGFGLKKGE